MSSRGSKTEGGGAGGAGGGGGGGGGQGSGGTTPASTGAAGGANGGGGTCWTTVTAPLLPGASDPTAGDFLKLVVRLADGEVEFQKCDEANDCFYTSLAILSAHCIASNISLLNPENITIARDACRIIITHILKKISEDTGNHSDVSTTPTFSILQLLSPLIELCDVDVSCQTQTNYSTIATHLKNSLPSVSTPDSSKGGQLATLQVDKASQRRTDSLGDILTGPLRMFPSSMSLYGAATQATSNGASDPIAITAPSDSVVVESVTTNPTQTSSHLQNLDNKKWLTETCISLLSTTRAGNVLLQLCGSLPCLQRYLTRVKAVRESASAVCQYHHAVDNTLVNMLLVEANICQMALSLPCFDPLTSSRITLLCDISSAWLLCATTQASVHLKDEDENSSATLVASAIGLFNMIGDTLMNSTWAGGYVYKNHIMIGTWIILGGLQILMGSGTQSSSQTTITGKSPAKTSYKPYIFCRSVQAMHVMWLALGGKCLDGIRTLLSDARLESQMDAETNTQDANAASLDPLCSHTAAQRVARLTLSVPLHQMLVAFGTVCYRKASGLKRAVVQKQHEQDADRSDSTVYYQDMIMCSEDSETDDEDSEPLLGLWFESTLVAPDGSDNCVVTSGSNPNDGQEGSRNAGTGIVPDKADPYYYINLAVEVFSLLDSEIMTCGPYLSYAARQLQDTSIVSLSNVIKELDKETARTDIGTIAPCYGPRLGEVYGQFSAVLSRYLHSMMCSSHFVEQRHMLLEHLDVLPPSPGEQNGTVPLQIGCRMLKLMGSMILSKPVSERELTILALWTKTINSLVEFSTQPQSSQDSEYEDINVEHAQLLIYLFHSLNLMQKKSVLLMTANAIIKVTSSLGVVDRKKAAQLVPHQLMLISRLLLLLEYIMKHLYDPPPCLLQQIKWNLVVAPGLLSNEVNGTSMVSRMYCSVPHVEQAYRRKMSQEIDNFMRPKFYALTNTDLNNQETPKLDGLACNFILGTPDKLKYPLLLDALLGLLGCVGVCDRRPSPSLSTLCAAHFCFQTVWRLLITMPPSTPHMEQVALGSSPTNTEQVCGGISPLHALIWAPRANHQKTFSPWLKDALVKQGMYTQYAENLLNNVSTACDNINYTIWLATKTMNQLWDNIPEGGGFPCLLDIITVDCVFMRLRVSLLDDAQITPMSGTPADTLQISQFTPHLLDLLETLFNCCRDCVVPEPTSNGSEKPSGSVENSSFDTDIDAVFRCCGIRGALWLRSQLPQSAKAALDKAATAPTCSKAPGAFLNDAIPSESAVLQLLVLHSQLMSGTGGIAAPLRLLTSGAIELLASRVFTLLEPGFEADKERAISLLLPAVVDGRLQFLQETASTALSTLVPSPVNSLLTPGVMKVEQMLHEEVLQNTYPIMVNHLTTANEKILRGMVKCWEKILERPSGRLAFEELFGPGKKCLGEVLLMAPNAHPQYSSRVVRLFNKLFFGCESSESPPSPLCISVCQKIGTSSWSSLTPWLSHICLGALSPPLAVSTPSDSDAATPTVPPTVAPAPTSTNPSTAKAESFNEGSNNSSPAPKNGQSDTAQQSESYSWCGGGSDSKESVAIPILSKHSENTDNAELLSKLIYHIKLHCNEAASNTLLTALVSLISEALTPTHADLPLPHLLKEAAHLADAHSGEGHKILFPAAMQWLNVCVESLCGPDVLERIEEGGGQRAQLEAACHLLAYLTDALHAGASEDRSPRGGLPFLSWDSPADLSLDNEWPDDQQDEEDTSADDSDEDSMLHTKVCTFLTTAREFMNQHWYHCHTCKMVEGIGVCTVCALVCHRNHDVSYAKFGNFFCDCGAKEESTCQALVKRSSSQSHILSKRGASEGDQAPPPSLRRRPSSPMRASSPPLARQPSYARNLSNVRDWIFSYGGWGDCLQSLQKLLGVLPGPVRIACERHAPVGRHGRARRALAQLHHGDKRFHTTDQLMVPTLGKGTHKQTWMWLFAGSQEGAFENVRMSYTGEQGQTIRQLISAHIVRRVAMCCLALPHGRRQHLVVSHEKGKITIYQLSALLKQADSSKRKLTLTRLTSIPIPFTVLSLSGNPWNEDLLAVCGLRECHIITFTVTGAVYERLVLQPALDTGNFIIRSIWLPGTQTQLALVTADFIKIYDLSKDAAVPQYHFLVPSGKVRDVTFVTQENATYMLCMGSTGHIYWQPMNDESHASNGPFYVTNTLEVFHNDIKDVTGQVGGGGVSIYYSHTLNILFFSYAQGKSFLAPLIFVEETLRGVSLISIGSTSGSQKEGGRGKGAQSLCQWQEVPAHPGLVTAVLQSSNNPVVLMLKPGSVAVQEIKVIPAKAKITDMVTVRHLAGQQELKTTLILLCEDGSLRIYAASPDQTGYWLSPAVAPPYTSPFSERSRRPKHNTHRSKAPQSSSKPGGAPTFPIDFFETCIALEDVEFGGNDLLQVYNTAQIKHRLNANGLFVVSTKLNGFTLEITNPDASTVITGIRVLLGNQDIARAPSFIEVCGRTIQTLGQRNRWYDIPLSREESLQADKKLSVTFSCSQDPEGVIMVDSVKVYGRNKEAFGWPEENEEGGTCASTSKNTQDQIDGGQLGTWRVAGVERLACALLEVLELALGNGGPGTGSVGPRSVVTRLLCLPSPPPLHTRCKALLKALLGPQYHQHKDQAVLAHITDELIELRQFSDPRNMDPENFFRLLLLTRAIAVSRPVNLVKYAGPLPVLQQTPSESSANFIENMLSGSEGSQHLAPLLANVLWVLGRVRQPDTPLALSPVDRCGLRHSAHALHALIDVLHAFMLHSDHVDLGNRIYVSLLLSEDQVISFGAKSAIVRVLRPRIKRRRVYIPSPPTTPGVSGVNGAPALEAHRTITPPEVLTEVIADHSDSETGNYGDVDQVVDVSRLLMAETGLEALLDIPPDADDETMVELAIALSLQERSTGTSASMAAGSGAPSDTTASAAASDDEEASGVAGAPPAVSPADLPTSESGSGADSIGGISGRSSTYGETGIRTAVESSVGAQWTQDMTIGTETATRLRYLRLSFLNVLLDELPQLRTIRGHRSIPFMQVLLMLASSLDANVEADCLALQRFLDIIIGELQLDKTEESTDPPESRTPFREMQLLIMRLLSVLMSRCKPTGAPAAPSSAPSTSRATTAAGSGADWHAARAAAGALLNGGAVERCRILLKALLPYWKEQGARTASDGTNVTPHNQLLRPQPPYPLPDMQPFFLKHYVKGHAWDVMENYPHLLTEMALRLPYKIHKHCDPPAPAFNDLWHSLLCEYMMNQQAPFLRKQVRKLLLMMCGTKERYRQLRDVHALSTHMEGVHEFVESQDLSYDSNVQLMDHLKACVEIVVARTGNWQYLCAVQSLNQLSYLMVNSCILDEGVAPTVLQLLQAALCPPAPPTTSSTTKTAPPNPERHERERSADSDASLTVSSKFQEQMVPQLVQQIQQKVTINEFKHFIRTFLLETNSTSVRWQAHALLLAIYENSSTAEQARLVELVWGLWPLLPQYGRKAAQFVDLLGYFSLKTPGIHLGEHLASAVNLLRTQNQMLLSHGNAPIYSALSNYVELDGYYLESEPCLVCNNPEVPMSTIKLSTIRIDSKFTTTTQIVKLVGSHTISHIGLRISDLKRSKMVRAINVFYNNRTVQAVQELKNKPGMWHKAKHVILQSGQAEVRIDFPLPIVACNLMMEYADFYENTQTSGESLQCPRCSAAVPANPGVCANCGENVFQCHRCRAINYDEKDPFLCHACGFCKYAKFDYSLTARSCCAVDTIENDEDRKKMVATIRTLLDKADRVYRQLVANKPLLESLLHKISEQRTEGSSRTNSDEGGNVGGNSGSSSTQVNRVIQSLAHKYCVDSKNHFDELSKVIQRVLTCRRELISYDKLQSEQLKGDVQPAYTALLQNEKSNKTSEGAKSTCYGCALAAASHCLTLLRALASSPERRRHLCNLGLVQELVQHNLRRGSLQSQEEVRQLICVVTKDNLPATKALCKLLSQRITLGLVGHAAAQDHTNAVRPLVLLLGGLVKMQDSVECWEVRLRCTVRLWVWCCPYLSNLLGGILPVEGEDVTGPPPLSLPPSAAQDSHALQQVALPCIQYLHHLMQPSLTNNKEKPNEGTNETIVSPPMSGAVLDLGAWLSGKVSYADWKRVAAPRINVAPPVPVPVTAPVAPIGPRHEELRDAQLAQKYTNYWREKVLRIYGLKKLCLGDGGWLRPVMFNPSSKMARDTACQMVKALCSGYERTKAILVQLTGFLPEIGVAGEASEQFLQLYQSLASDVPWKQFLALRGVLSLLADLLTKEIQHLHKLEETTLTSDLAQGYALKKLTELLAMFLEDGGIRRAYKGRLMGAVLGGYLSLRRLVVQRTRLIDDTQEKLLELLEEMTTGTEAETAEFMAVCIETVKKYPLHDFLTPVFIFERLCSIIYPEENDVREFFLTLEKDPQQEDFLQGRMLGNPYSSLEPGLGPLMRDVKNKICADCELVALLEDDTGMELLVNNKIMSLDLPVKDVYKKVWAVSGEGDAMRVVYRMRGLLGDATEEFVETLNASSVETVDDEQLYKMANVLADCGGMEVMLERLAAASGAGGAARPLARTLLRLLLLCARARRCVAVLTLPSTGSLPALLRALQLAATDEATRPRPELTYQLLEIMDRILSVAAGESLESFLQFSLTFGGPEYVQALLNCTESAGIRGNQEALAHLTRVLAALVYGNELKMAHLCQHFKQVLDFNKFDSERWAEDEFRLDLFCVFCSGIERNAIGGTLKDYFISLGIVRDALDYIIMHAPCVKPTLLRTDSDELKEFIAKPALKYILRFLTGLAADHEPTQMAVCEKVIPIVHRLEQVSSDEHVGSLAENLLEALMSEPEAAKKVQEARDYTRQEKKRLAMAMREKQLGALGMRTNDKGQVTAQCSFTHQVQELGEETGAVCCICREGYKYQPTKVLGIYTFTKRCGVEEYEVKARKTLGYTTVTHFNVVHVECHMAAVRLARTRDEWESAALQNASTKCNGLLPLWGPHVPESAFASCLARHNTYLQESTGHRDIGYQCTVHDLKLLLMRFAREKQFHEDTGGGGPLSNMQLVPCLMHMALYVINTTRVAGRELTAIQTYLEWAPARQLESAHDAEGPLYYAVMALLLQPPQKWQEERLEHLRRLLLIAQVRSLIPSGPPLRSLEPEQKEPRPYEDFKPYLIFFSLIELIFNVMFKNIPTTNIEQWPIKLAEAIRHGDETVLRSSEKILSTLSDELLPCTSFAEWCDAAGLLGLIPDPDEFMLSALRQNTMLCMI